MGIFDEILTIRQGDIGKGRAMKNLTILRRICYNGKE